MSQELLSNSTMQVENLFNIAFSRKRSGIQTGSICDVSNGIQTVRYYIKNRQYGPTETM